MKMKICLLKRNINFIVKEEEEKEEEENHKKLIQDESLVGKGNKGKELSYSEEQLLRKYCISERYKILPEFTKLLKSKEPHISVIFQIIIIMFE